MITPRDLTTKTAEMDFSGEYNWKNQKFKYNCQTGAHPPIGTTMPVLPYIDC